MKYNYNDGGRTAAGFVGGVNDCVTRAVSLSTGCGYAVAKQYLAHLMTAEGVNVFSEEFINSAAGMGLLYVSVVQKPFKVSQLPTSGIYIAHTAAHVSAVIEGTIEDTFDTSDEMLKGYWLVKSTKGYDLYTGDIRLNSHALDFASALRMRDLYHLNFVREKYFTIRPAL